MYRHIPVTPMRKLFTVMKTSDNRVAIRSLGYTRTKKSKMLAMQHLKLVTG